tara:strand:- start:3225 stop:3344 length:120 start_codon:yes stop_codon:yes gene_type:complete
MEPFRGEIFVFYSVAPDMNFVNTSKRMFKTFQNDVRARV